MPYSGERSRQIHHAHNLAAKKIAENIGVVRQRQFRQLGNRFANRAALEFFIHRSSFFDNCSKMLGPVRREDRRTAG